MKIHATSGSFIRCGLIIVILVIICLTLTGIMPGLVSGQSSLDLELGGTGAASWSLTNIKPGDSGTKVVELRNNSSATGTVTIWISDIVESDHGGDGAILDEYLLFSVSCARAVTNISLPARINALPQNADDADYLTIRQLDAGETVTLVWRWEFLDTGGPQNEAQGDSLSFTINYLLEELTSNSGGNTDVYHRVYVPPYSGKSTSDETTTSGITTPYPWPLPTEPPPSTLAGPPPAPTAVDSDITQPPTEAGITSTIPAVPDQSPVASLPPEVNESLTMIIITVAAAVAAFVLILLYLRRKHWFH
jgi:hypothetical protein